MVAAEPAMRMPPLASSMPDTRGAALIARWIDGMREN
jgi:hypothetical protein